tara:strand:+ start:95 stop:373 length:279 start_codon:yes stop_codon:yes gene_type:complete
MNFQTSEEIRRINTALSSLKRRAVSKILDSRNQEIDPIFKEQIINPSEGNSIEALKEVSQFEESILMQSKFGRTYIKGWIKKPIKSVWKRFK